MLELIDIRKDYQIAGGAVHALKGVSIKFRKNEFVSILGASGCGKTTLLNIIGGLDKYTSGDLIIEGTSTKQYKDGDWDTYRNHSIGFIFQSYHLIPHQTILQNVELALTIAGVSKEERRRRAAEALEKVGLGDKINTRPNQLSGGQAQRVAIARALINDPEIVLADEPTGALDSKTSVQIMNLLKEISNDRLVIMVTHNPELAEEYSTRIIRLLDGEIVDDSMPYDGADENAANIVANSEDAQNSLQTAEGEKTEGLPEQNSEKRRKNKGKKKKSAMSVGMAFMLSLKNLLSKAKRTTLVSFAGSIGIIGVSMVLAISAGVHAYIGDMEDDMLSGYPVSITRSAIDYTSLMNMNHNAKPDVNITKLDDRVYVNSLMETLGTFATGFSKMNVITENYIDYIEKMPVKYYNVLQYGYDFSVANNIYTDFKVTKDSPLDGSADASANMSVTGIRAMYSSILDKQPEYKQWANTISTVATFTEVPDNYEYIMSQYDVVASNIYGDDYTAELTADELKAAFSAKDTLVMVVDNMEVNDLVLGQFGYMTEEEFLNYAYKAVNSDDYNPDLGLVGGKTEDGENGLTYEYFLGEDAKKFTYYSNDSAYTKLPFPLVQKDETTGKEYTINYLYNPYSAKFEEEGLDLKVKLILQKKDGISYGCLQSGFYYTKALTTHVLENEKNSNIVKFIEENGALDMVPYTYNYSYWKGDTLITSSPDDPENKPGHSAIVNADSASVMNMLMSGLGSGGGADLQVTAAMLGGSDMPASINIYPVDFDNKKLITQYLDEWNNMCDRGEAYGTSAALGEKDKITYTDTVRLIINMVNTMIQMITIALIAFTALSLVVSTVMIGIITYVSVVERIKEIGILRAIGSRSNDVFRIFFSESFIIAMINFLLSAAGVFVATSIINAVIRKELGVLITVLNFGLRQILLLFVVSLFVATLASFLPVKKIASKKPIDAIRNR